MFLRHWVLPNIDQWIPELELGQPKCRNYHSCSENNCSFFHPFIECRNFDTPTSCADIFCRFKHPICPNDEICNDTFCTFEHKLSDPVLLKIHKAKQGRMLFDLTIKRLRNSNMLKNEGIVEDTQMNREFDDYIIGNINWNADQSYSQEKAPAKEGNENGKISFVKTDEYLRVVKRIRCYFSPHCDKINCDFAHPRRACWYDFDCKYGRNCAFLHSKCDDDGKCTNENCPREHYEQLHPFRLEKVTKEDAQTHKEYAKNRLEQICEDLRLPSFPSFPSNMDTSLSCVILSPDNESQNVRNSIK